MTTNKDGIHNTQTKEELEIRLEEIANRLGCHTDIIYGRIADLQSALIDLDPSSKLLQIDTVERKEK